MSRPSRHIMPPRRTDETRHVASTVGARHRLCPRGGASTSWRSPPTRIKTRRFAGCSPIFGSTPSIPPENEIAGVQFFKAIFDAEGIAYETVESAPGRGNIWARLKGGDQPALMLLHHMDVLLNKASWQTVSVLWRDQGRIHLRPVLDIEASSGILHLAAFVALHRSKRPR